MSNQETTIFSPKNIFSGRSGTTDVSSLTTGAIGLVLTLIFYLVFPLPLLKGSYVYTLFAERGKIQYAITLLFFWALSILVFKLIKLLEQQSVLKLNIFPEVPVIRPRDADKLMAGLKNLDKEPQDKIFLNRIWIALEHFKSQGKVEKVDEILQHQGEIDMEIMESSYTIFKVFIWAIPILGFIGTVLGIGSAVGGFSEFTKTALEIEQIKTALDVITAGLSVAFDTTLLGLVCALILMLPGTALQKMEGAFLIAVEKFCMHNLLNRFRGDGSGQVVGPLDEEKLANKFKQAIEETFENYLKMLQDSFQSWSGGFGEVMEGVTGQSRHIGEQLTAIRPIAESFRQSMDSFSGQLKNIAGQQSEMMTKLTVQLGNIQPLIGSLSEISSSLNQERKLFHEQVNTWMQNLDRVGSNITDKIADQNQQTLASMNEVKNTLEQERRSFQEQAATWMQNLERVGRSIVDKIGEQQQQDLSSQNQQLQELMQNFNSLAAREEQIIALINKSFEQMAASDSMFKDTLQGIMQGLQEVKPTLEQLARPKTVRLIQE